MARRPTLPPFLEEGLKTPAADRLPENPQTQDDIQWSGDFLGYSAGIPYTFYPTVAGPVCPGNSCSTPENGRLDVTVQLQQQSKGSFAVGSPTTPLPIPWPLEDPPLPPFGYQANMPYPTGGPSAMPRTPYPPTFAPSVPTEAYNPTFTTTPVWHGSQASSLSGPEGSQGCPAPSTQLTSPTGQRTQWAYLANPYHPTGETPPSVYDSPTPTNSSAPCDRTVRKPCGWRRPDGTLCGAEVTYQCQGHLAMAHGITKLSGKAPVWCKWCCPDHQIKRDGLLRHVREVHLGVPRSKRGHA